jgi:hypothetical protein
MQLAEKYKENFDVSSEGLRKQGMYSINTVGYTFDIMEN